MFYYPNVLQRHTGCFATIWLAATRGTRLVKREYLEVNVVKTCEEILNYVLVRAEPPMPGLPRPRFSLYLSAQLQIGVIRVYSQQCQYLVEDIQHILERLHRAQLQIRIDMVEAELPSLLLPSHLAMMEALEDAPDPFFGMMSVDPRLPSPFDIPQIRHLLEAAIPERVYEVTPPEVPTEPRKPGQQRTFFPVRERLLVTVLPPEVITLREVEPIRMLHIEIRHLLEAAIPERVYEVTPPEVPTEPRKPERLLVTVLPPEVITLREVEPIRMLHIEGERELPEVTRRDLELLIAEEEEAILLEEYRKGRLPRQPALDGQTPGMGKFKEEIRAPEAEIVVPSVSPPAPPQIEEIREPLPEEVLAPEELKPVVWEPITLVTEVTPPEELRLPALPSPEPMVQPLEKTITSPAELFRTPALPGWLPLELLDFWTHCAQIPPRLVRRRPSLEAEEEAAAREAAAEEERRKTEALSEIEVLREAQEPSGPLMVSSEISLEAAEEEKSRISFAPPEERWPWAEAEQPEAPALPVVPELPEVPMELPLELPPEPELPSLEAVHRAVALELQANREPDFSSLVSPLSPRRMAARVFYLLLVLSAQQIFHVEQEKPYGRLLIRPGPRFHCG
ncbi:Meiotic recombination protein REC8-like protein [Heterocephalus glaber]|uniref:Meiotic recombination protein REC8-like protein n=1 Tax=Heterocephalus glaber TaxID=10181 RepID=G5B291_HETGA|nr:Meiotic recombination protein REC8-like protein [Heterocephalus glaber]